MKNSTPSSSRSGLSQNKERGIFTDASTKKSNSRTGQAQSNQSPDPADGKYVGLAGFPRKTQNGKTRLGNLLTHSGGSPLPTEALPRIAHGYIEAHHEAPLAMLPIDRATRLSPSDDFVVLCANFHGMIHRPGAPPTFREFLELYLEDSQ